MATTMAKQNKLKRNESRKSHSWWWNSHISPKNSKWLQENLEEMDGYVKRMLKLIEEDADSFAKRAEMYYKKRPELVNHVEEFYRMYRALAERYDLVTGELRKRIPVDLQSQGSGISDTSSEHSSTLPSSDHHPMERRSSGPRAAGFDIFLGGGGGSKSDKSNKGGDESSTSDSEPESDDSSVINYPTMPGDEEEQALRKRVSELEAEISEVKEKNRLLEEEISKGSNEESKGESPEGLLARLAGYEQELYIASEKIRLSEEEISKLKDELQKSSFEVEKGTVIELQESHGDSEVLAETQHQIQILEEELKITKEKLLASETEVETLRQQLLSSEASNQHLNDQLGSAQKDVILWKTEVEDEKNEVSELKDRLEKCESNLSDRDYEIKGLREAISNANMTLSEENSRLHIQVSELLEEKNCLDNNLKEMDLRCQSLQEEVSRVKAGKEEIKIMLGAEIEKLKAGIDEKNNLIKDLNGKLDAFLLKYETLLAEKKEVDCKITIYISEIGTKNIKIDEMNKHLHQLHMEHVKLIVAAEEARKQAQDLQSTVRELEKEVEKQQEVVKQGAEEKREAIRQLCFSLEHYRNGYHMLRQAVTAHKRHPVMAS